MSSTIQPETILRELSELWVSLGKEVEPGPSGVLRACAMTFIATTDGSEDPSDVWATIAALMPEHPSRAIVIRFHQGSERELSSRVFSQCWMPFGHRRQICCEQIEITASDASLPDLAPVILPLAVADLPVILWCRGARLFQLAEFPQLAKVAHKLVLDSAEFAEPAAILGRFEALIDSGHPLADLEWTRLTRWREMVSQVFENRNYLARLPEVRKIRIAFAGKSAPGSAYYLAAWLLNCLGNAGAAAGVEWQAGPEAAGRGLVRLELTSDRPDGLQVSIAGQGSEAVELRVESLVSRTVFPEDNDYRLLREELSIPGHDAVFEASLRRAARLARGEAS